MMNRELLGRPIAFHAILSRISGSVASGVMLAQAIYWDGITEDPNGWFWKSREDWENETTLTRYEQETARKALRRLGLIEERNERLTHKMFYRVVWEVVEKLIEEFPRKLETNIRDGKKQAVGESILPEGGNPSTGEAANHHPSKEQRIPQRLQSETTARPTDELDLGISKPKKQSSIPNCLLEVEGFTAEWDNFKAHRKTIRKPMTSRAAELILETLSERPTEALAAVRTAIEKCWTGIKWEWIDNLHSPRFNGTNGHLSRPPLKPSKWDTGTNYFDAHPEQITDEMRATMKGKTE